MAIELYPELENPNLTTNLCRPELNVSGLGKGLTQISSIISVSDGYIKKDKILLVELSESLLENLEYSFLIKKSYDILFKYKVSKFYIEEALEFGGKTRLKIYSSEQNLINFFDNLEPKNLDDCYINFYESLQVSNDLCENSGFIVVDIKETTAKVILLESLVTSKIFKIRYRKVSEPWSTISTSSLENVITNLESNSFYEIKYCKKCSNNLYSFYSTPIKIKTF